jgi:starvation-inducible outer membrane lipoprotein
MKFVILLFLALAPLLSGCADAPTWLGGEPADVPPRPGSPAYEAWQAQRAKEFLQPKANKGEPNSTANVY